MHQTDWPAVWLGILTTDFLRYAVTAGVVYGLLWWLFPERLRARRVFDDAPRRGQIPREIRYSLFTVLIFAANGFALFALMQAGHTRIYTDVSEYGRVWWILSLVTAIVLHDAWFYWTHRLLHHRWWFRHVHRVHHLSTNPTPWAAYSFHPMEALIHAAFYTLLVLAVPLHTATIFVFLLFMIVRNCIGHSGHELLPWRLATRGWLRWNTTVTHHHFHHARNRGNFGLYFTWWDRLCGTEDPAHRAHGDLRFGASAAKEQP